MLSRTLCGDPRDTAFHSVGVVHGGGDHFSQTLQRNDVALLKCVSSIGQQLEHAADFLFVKQRHHHDRPNPQDSTTLLVNSRIRCRVVAAQNLPGADALSGQSRAQLKLCADLGCGWACPSAANQLFTLAQGNRRSRGTCDVLSSFRQELQGNIQIALPFPTKTYRRPPRGNAKPRLCPELHRFGDRRCFVPQTWVPGPEEGSSDPGWNNDP